MILAQAKKLLQKFQVEIERLENSREDLTAPLDNFLETVYLYNKSLKELVLSTSFENTKEEITFFKSIKPQFICLQLYYLALQDLNMKCPKGNRKRIRKLYEKELQKIECFFEANRSMVHYYHSGVNHMDEELFVRGLRYYPNWLVEIRTDVDDRFSTAADYLIARILAAEKIQDHIIKFLDSLENPPDTSAGTVQPDWNLNWTGESINLIEIAYGIWLTGQINNGNATVSEIVRWLETTLKINIGRAYRRWTEISRRDSMTTTKYLDRMKEAIHTRLINEDDLKRQKRQLLKNS